MKINKKELMAMAILFVFLLPSNFMAIGLSVIAMMFLLQACIGAVKYFMPVIMDISEEGALPFFPKQIFGREDKSVILRQMIFGLLFAIMLFLFMAQIVRGYELIRTLLFRVD